MSDPLPFPISVPHNHENHFPLSTLNKLTLKVHEDIVNDKTNNFEFTSQEPVCSYYFLNEPSKIESFPTHHFKLLSYNISSIPLHFDTFTVQVLDFLNFQFDVISICETRLNDNLSSLYSLNNYLNYFQNKSTSGGGIVIYIRKTFQSFQLKHISFQLPHIESLFIKITHPHTYIVGMLYRPPNTNIADFLASMDTILQHLTNDSRVPCYITGDFNINLLKHKTDNNVKELINLLYSYYMFPVVTKPTRVTQTSASLIDHIWTNDIHSHQNSGIMNITISDHFPVFASFSRSLTTTDTHKTITKTQITDENIVKFRQDLSVYSWEQDVKSINVDEDYDIYVNKLLNIYHKNFPTKTILIKEKFSDKPYITPAIKTSIKHRHKLQKLFAKWPLTYGEQFKRYRNTLTTIIRQAKQNYYKTKLSECSGNNEKTWQTINNLIGRKKSQLPSFFSHNNTNLINNIDIAEGFNEYFSSVGKNLAEAHSDHNAHNDTVVHYKHFLPPPVPFSLYLKPTTLSELRNVIANLKLTSPGHDNIDIRVVKECSDIILPFLKYIINLSFQHGCFPKNLQISKVTPIYKKGSKSQLNNYRPISLLSTFSKIFEKVMVARLMDYLTKHSLLTDHQYGFRPGFSTERAVHSLCRSMYHSLDMKCYQITLFCDLTKAFDTISHNILLDKLKVYGVRGPAYIWLKSYLNHRQQYTVINNTPSSMISIDYGIPQGSVLGPILFLIYINDIIYSSKKLNFLLFADDTTIYIKGHDLLSLQHTMNEELIHVANWLKSNKLTLNYTKTNYIVSHSLLNQPAPTNIIINNIPIHKVSEVNFLGIIIDNNLKWKAHIENIKTKLSKFTGIIYRIRAYLNQENIKLVYSSLVYPSLLYCSAVWGGAYQTYTQSLFITQKKLLRIMFNCNPYEHTNPYFQQHKILKVHDIIHLQTCLFVYTNLIMTNSTGTEFEIMTHTGRRAHMLRIPLCRTSHAQQSVLVRGARLWNHLPDHLKTCPTKYNFKRKLKEVLLSTYND